MVSIGLIGTIKISICKHLEGVTGSVLIAVLAFFKLNFLLDLA